MKVVYSNFKVNEPNKTANCSVNYNVISINGLKKWSGLCSGLKRLINFIIDNNDSENRFHFMLRNNFYKSNGFEYIYTNQFAPTSKDIVNLPMRFRHLNSSIHNTPSPKQCMMANSIITKYFQYNSDVMTMLEHYRREFSCHKYYSSVIYRGTDKIKECPIGSYEQFWGIMDKYKASKYFLMSDEQEFIDETSKRFDTFFINCMRSHRNGDVIHKMNLDLRIPAQETFVNLEIAAASNLCITNYSNTTDFVQFINPNIQRICVV